MLKNRIMEQNKEITTFEIKSKGKKYQCKINTKDFNDLPHKTVCLRNSKQKYPFFSIDGKHKYIHKIIQKCKSGFIVDHKDGDVLNCKRDNLQSITQSINVFKQRNRKRDLPRGITIERGKYYKVQIGKNGRNYYGGTYKDLDMAVKIYLLYSQKLYGEL